jgi:2'-5' RNA ligase
MSTHVRAFVALAFSVPVTRRIAEEVARRKAQVAEAGLHVAWVPAANLHVTLKFLGSIPEESLEAVAGRLRRLAARHPPFEARAARLGAFPSLERPRVLWVGVDGGEAMGKLARDVEAQMAELGFARPEEATRVFHPHVTVGRVKHGAPLGASWTSEVELGASTMSELVVYESRTKSSGAEYVARARVSLGNHNKET